MQPTTKAPVQKRTRGSPPRLPGEGGPRHRRQKRQPADVAARLPEVAPRREVAEEGVPVQVRQHPVGALIKRQVEAVDDSEGEVLPPAVVEQLQRRKYLPG